MCAKMKPEPGVPCRAGWIVVHDPFAPRKILFCYDPATGQVVVKRKGVERFVDLSRLIQTRHP